MADQFAKLRPLLAGLHEEAATRVLREIRSRYSAITQRPDLRMQEQNNTAPRA